MANNVDSYVTVEGPTEAMNQFAKEWSPDKLSEIQLGITQANLSFETHWHFPSDALFSMIRTYGPKGLKFHLWWHDDDGGLGIDPLFGGDLTNCSFGECYTRDVPSGIRLLDSDKVLHHILMIDRHSTCMDFDEGAGYHELSKQWVEQLVPEPSNIGGVIDRGLAEYPDSIPVIAVFPRDGICIHYDESLGEERLIHRNVFVTDLIRTTWGEQWFVKRGISAIKEDDLTQEELRQLIIDAYPDQLERLAGRLPGDHERFVEQQATAMSHEDELPLPEPKRKD